MGKKNYQQVSAEEEIRRRLEEYTAPYDSKTMEECYSLVQSGQKKCSCRDGSLEGGCRCRICFSAGKPCSPAEGEGVCATAEDCKRCPLYLPCWK